MLDRELLKGASGNRGNGTPYPTGPPSICLNSFWRSHLNAHFGSALHTKALLNKNHTIAVLYSQEQIAPLPFHRLPGLSSE